MIPSLLDRWRRRLDLDQVRPKPGTLDEPFDRVLPIVDDGSCRSIELLLRYILLQALVDRAIGIHFFSDEEDACIRMLYCLAVPPELKYGPMTPSGLAFDGPRMDRVDMGSGPFVWPDPADPAYERIWYEMVPPPISIALRLFDRLRWYAGLRAGQTEGHVSIRLDGRIASVSVVAPRPDDIRIFFGAEQPPMWPKLKRYFDELGRPYPG